MISFALAMTFCSMASTAAPSSDPLRKELERIASSFRGKLGYSLHHIKKRERLDRLGDELFPSASTIKLAILCAAMDKNQRGEMGYYETRAYESEDRRGGSGLIQNYKEGSKLELKELLHLMITVSDNTATAMMIKWLGAMTVNDWLDSHGLSKTRLLRDVPKTETELTKLAAQWGLGVTTPNEMTALMEMIRDGRAGTAAGCDEMRRILSHSYFDQLIPSQIPPHISVASKFGALTQSRSDVALVHSPSGDYVLAVFTKENEDQRWLRDNAAEEAIRAISRAVWKHYHPKDKWTPPPGTEKF